MADGGFLRESSPPTGGALPLSGQGGRETPTLTAPPPRPPPPDSVAASGCSRCTSLSFNQEWLAAFHVALCNTCRQNEKLVSKSTARIRYTLTDSDLKPLGSLRKANPHRKDWQPMHLYMQSQFSSSPRWRRSRAPSTVIWTRCWTVMPPWRLQSSQMPSGNVRNPSMLPRGRLLAS
ncbi:XPA1 [Auxenochlorella protothecoides x Auxenochlorella symbiontica]